MAFNKSYFDSYHEIDAYRSLYPDENIIRFLHGHFPEDQRSMTKVLDLGCGCGRHIILLKDLGFEAYGIDGSPVGLRYARHWLKARGLHAELKEGRIGQLPYADDFFDALIEEATLVNNTWEDILHCCDECYRVMKAGAVGFFLLKTKNDCAFDDAEQIGKNAYLIHEKILISRQAREYHDKMLFHSFTRPEIKKMFRKFRKVRIHSFNTSFKALHIDCLPGERLTSYWIVIIQK